MALKRHLHALCDLVASKILLVPTRYGLSASSPQQLH